MKSLTITLLLIVIITMVGVTVLGMYKALQNNPGSITIPQSNINYISRSSTTLTQSNTSVTSSIIAVKNVTTPLSEGIYLLNNSNIIYIVYGQPITQLKIFNYTFVRGGPISTFNGIIELQNTAIYQELENQKEISIQIYNDTSWKTITLYIMYTTQGQQPYAFLIPNNEIEPF